MYCSTTDLHTTVKCHLMILPPTPTRKKNTFLSFSKMYFLLTSNSLYALTRAFLITEILITMHLLNCFCTRACSEHKESLCTQQLGCFASVSLSSDGKSLTPAELLFLGCSTRSQKVAKPSGRNERTKFFIDKIL